MADNHKAVLKKDIELKFLMQGIDRYKLNSDCTELVSIDTDAKYISIPRGIKVLHRGCLSGLDLLEKVVIPKDLERVDACALANCPNLKYIVYDGDNEEIIKNLKVFNNGKIIKKTQRSE